MPFWSPAIACMSILQYDSGDNPEIFAKLCFSTVWCICKDASYASWHTGETRNPVKLPTPGDQERCIVVELVAYPCSELSTTFEGTEIKSRKSTNIRERVKCIKRMQVSNLNHWLN